MLQQVEANFATVNFAAMDWQYEDPVARAELTRRIRQAGAKQKPNRVFGFGSRRGIPCAEHQTRRDLFDRHLRVGRT